MKEVWEGGYAPTTFLAKHEWELQQRTVYYGKKKESAKADFGPSREQHYHDMQGEKRRLRGERGIEREREGVIAQPRSARRPVS